jgi:hypothetical protein
MATIYKIYCRDSEITDCYVGSTEDFHTRCREHKTRCNNTNSPKYNYKVYKYIRANGGLDNFIIQEIIDCEIEDRYDCELYYFKLFEAKLNTKFPKRNKTQYKIDNKETIQKYKKQHYIDNREQIREQTKQYRIHNKEKIKEHKNQKHNCECGKIYTQCHKARHIKSTKHQNYINSKL